jgi:hypothetical protein
MAGAVSSMELKLATKILSDLIFFVLRADGNVNAPLSVQGTPDRDRQKVLREQNILEEVFHILRAPFSDPVSASPSLARARAPGLGPFPSQTDGPLGMRVCECVSVRLALCVCFSLSLCACTRPLISCVSACFCVGRMLLGVPWQDAAIERGE